jgi:hypothetical protein
MSESKSVVCPGCRAKLKFERQPKARVTCGRCGQEFDCQPTAEIIDPFAEDELVTAGDGDPSTEADEPVESLSEFEQALQDMAEARRPVRRDIDFGDDIVEAPAEEDEDEFGPVPVLRPAPAPVGQRRAKEVPPKKSRKRKRKRAALSADTLWLYLAGAVLLALVVFVIAVTVRPGAIFGRSLTPAEIAGTYVSEDHPGLRLTFVADGTWEIDDANQGFHFGFGGLVYSIKGRKIICDVLEELKPQPQQPILIERPLALRHRTMYDRIVAEFSDLSFKNGMLISPTKGRFTREPGPEEGDPALAAPAAGN